MRLKNCVRELQAWFEKIFGTFKDDPYYDEAMQLGRQYCESQQPDYEDDAEQA